MTLPSLPILAIAGPTASGKTAAALSLVETLRPHMPVEIISVDSALVYRGMDIGTAKPSAAERAACPHHLIDILDPLDAYSAAEFVRDTVRLVAEIRSRQALPLLVGGTMLYFKALIDGMDDMPAADPAVRAELDAQATRDGWPAMHARLAEVDPTTAARLAPNDSQRIQRALEVHQLSGQPMSALHGRLLKPLGDERVHLFTLEPQDRAWLHARIAQRFDAMLAGGFMAEMHALRQRGDLNPDLPSMRAVGYRQAWEALDGAYPMAEMRERGIAATRQLAKRQITWLRSMSHRTAIDCQQPDAQMRLVNLAMHSINQAVSGQQ